ncbi:BZ3500_MvSof-1268-A1-R1_Chr1-1g01198 [Microbotryum saponariae]|uniref:BZ3500_MvSof-1268-A1-R1_Chr1-1g01198 protein n=1 Tax=Microbotryum saponariae TaxID=289078 RepID=A0A2X0ME23_9BASI|nr:BZ3500_MvSof-1268-A1-R1_Chr1-1g01198 [Microbotryum saponariae]SCZ93635.1 BZ3501_MvSof-1269-A2-R1_Chr1-1g00794 [Microbotryum saponariae]
MLLSFSQILALGASFGSIQAVVAAPTPGSVDDSATAKSCKSAQYFNKRTKSCLPCTSKFTNALTCTESEATSCSRGKLDDGKCQLRTSCSGPCYVSPQDGFTCIACPDSKASRCDSTGKSVACNIGTPVNGKCAAVTCTGAILRDLPRCQCTQSTECEYGVVTKGKCVAFKCPPNTANTADAGFKPQMSCQQEQQLLVRLITCCKTILVALTSTPKVKAPSRDACAESSFNTVAVQTGTACCSDIYTASCAPSLAPLKCKPDAVLNTIGNHCVLPVAVSQYGNNTSKTSGVTPTGGYPVTYMQWGSNPVTSYDSCASFAAKQSPSNDRGQTLFFWNGSSCWVQSRSSYVSSKFAKGSYSLNIFGHCRNTAKSAPATDAYHHGIDCGDVTAKI